MKVNTPAKAATSGPLVTALSPAWLQRQCACGQHTVAGGTCETCNGRQHELDHHGTDRESQSLSHVVSGVLNSSSAMPLDSRTQRSLAGYFGREFGGVPVRPTRTADLTLGSPHDQREQEAERVADTAIRDRKSTRLNSSHDQISYAVFCLKKKKKKK